MFARMAVLSAAIALIATPDGAVFAQSRLPAGRAENQILVLGTSHLSVWPKTVPLGNLKPVLDRLAAWKPQMIAIESIAGMQCWTMRHQPDMKEMADNYCPDTKAGKAATGLDVPAAVAERDKMLADWPKLPSAAQRRKLAAIMMAAGDPSSALVQWLRLAPADRRVGDGIDNDLLQALNKRMSRRNEDEAIAARLAVRLGLERLVQMDSQNVQGWVADGKAYGKAIEAAWNRHHTPPSPAEAAARGPGLNTPAGVLAAYRLFNTPDFARVTYNRDFGAALTDPSARQYGRRYVTYWETRNLRMASNIREALGEYPGSRMLVIVGASHKAYLDRYLSQMRDARIVDAEKILR